jgi:predicted small lipoprotein YifL
MKRLLAILSILVLAGCGQKAPVAAPSPVDSPSASPSPSKVVAADGTNAGACADGACQILLTQKAEFSVGAAPKVVRFFLTYTAPRSTRIDLVYKNGHTSHTIIEGTGNAQFAAGVTVTIEAVAESGAVVRVALEANDPDNDRATGSEGLNSWSD